MLKIIDLIPSVILCSFFFFFALFSVYVGYGQQEYY